MLQANIYLQIKDYEKALKFANKVSSSDMAYPYALYVKGQSQLALLNFDKVDSIIKQLDSIVFPKSYLSLKLQFDMLDFLMESAQKKASKLVIDRLEKQVKTDSLKQKLALKIVQWHVLFDDDSVSLEKYKNYVQRYPETEAVLQVWNLLQGVSASSQPIYHHFDSISQFGKYMKLLNQTSRYLTNIAVADYVQDWFKKDDDMYEVFFYKAIALKKIIKL